MKNNLIICRLNCYAFHLRYTSHLILHNNCCVLISDTSLTITACSKTLVAVNIIYLNYHTSNFTTSPEMTLFGPRCEKTGLLGV